MKDRPKTGTDRSGRGSKTHPARTTKRWWHRRQAVQTSADSATAPPFLERPSDSGRISAKQRDDFHQPSAPKIEATTLHKEVAHLLQVAGVVVLVLSLLIMLTGRMSSFRHEEALDFGSVQRDHVILDYMLTRSEIGTLGLGYLEEYGVRPDLGVFGNHQIQLFSSESFGRTKDSGFFFNYWYANLGLPELRDEFYYLSSKNLLPKKLALIHITTPNNDNGWHIIKNRGNELPADIRHFAASNYAPDPISLGWTYFKSFRDDLYSRLLWANIMRSAYRESGYVVLDPASCGKSVDRELPWFYKIPGYRTIRQFILPPTQAHLCERIPSSISRDGSAHPRRIEVARGPLRKNDSAVNEKLAGLSFGDETEIQGYMREIFEIGSRRGVQVVFVILPVYESSDRSQSPLNHIMDKALSGIPEIPVIDHRRIFLGPENFSNFDHPNGHYFDHVLSPEICQKYMEDC